MPPGRGGRLWLRGRIAFAQRSLELLDRKQLLLRQELLRLGGRRDTARDRFRASCADADRWGVRAAALGGTGAVDLAATVVRGQAGVDVPWRNTMGVWHPADPSVAAAVLPPAEAAAGDPTIAPAADAYRAALEAGATWAALDRSVSVLDAELRATQRRRRAIERRRLLALDTALRRLELHLDELEREERVVARWALRHRKRGTRAPAATAGPKTLSRSCRP